MSLPKPPGHVTHRLQQVLEPQKPTVLGSYEGAMHMHQALSWLKIEQPDM